ncbi:uncharacterized protein LOC116425704 [Nomia melanderi]|uniref:uncharacterized protein LOC116425704 n=1 Tax=Nomia melanderi TaxID=2448451 RepID=UPI001303FE36|nr:uncharacterized protein LOC116425704 [Nomia melanderi]
MKEGTRDGLTNSPPHPRIDNSTNDRNPEINQWWSTMDNLSDVYYLVQLMFRQIFVYLRDLILYKFFWLAATSDDFDSSDSTLRGLTSRNLTADVLAFSVICAVLFLLVMLSSKCERDEGRPYVSTGIETVSVNFEENLCRPLHISSNATDCLDACGDTIFPRRRILERNLSHESFSRVRSSNRKRNRCILKRSIFGLTGAQLHSSQSTQTEKLLPKICQKWLVRRTRSGLVYGKYPV